MSRTRLNEHAQPLQPFNARWLSERVHSEMLGLVRGLLADQQLTDDEILLFRDWLQATPEAAAAWPGKHLAERLLRILVDGIVTDEEKSDLVALMSNFTGGITTAAAGSGRGAVYTPTKIAFTTPAPTIVVEGRHFVLTGQFVTGTRSYCELQIVTRGGLCQSAPTRVTEYVVVGSISSEQWAESAYGRKIQKAVSLREKGYPVAIVPEEHWVIALGI